jgi:hypothetical protein
MGRFEGKVQPGDVICTRSNGWWSRIIRFGAALRGRANLVNHVAVAHHFDAAGTLWGVEGRPGGVGWVDLTNQLKSPMVNANVKQPKTEAQRLRICEYAEQLLGTPYDWTAIVVSAMDALRINLLWYKTDEKGGVPAHVICSAFADWAYEHVGLPSPRGTNGKYTTPADWDELIINEGWN